MDSYHAEVKSSEVYPMNMIIPINMGYFPVDPPSGHQHFNIRVHKIDSRWQVSSPEQRFIQYTSRSDFFNISKNSIEPMIGIILQCLNIPIDFHGSLTTKILNLAENMANITHKDQKMLYLGMDIHVESYEYDNNSDDDNDGDYDDDDQDMEAFMELNPASKSSIERLEKVEVNEQEGLSPCTICREGFRADIETVRMPCLHTFHKNCIVDWLLCMNNCPICRFQLPSEDS